MGGKGGSEQWCPSRRQWDQIAGEVAGVREGGLPVKEEGRWRPTGERSARKKTMGSRGTSWIGMTMGWIEQLSAR
jgi:hypothetical protein